MCGMLDLIWVFMILIGIIYGIINGRLTDVSNAILDCSGQAITLAISMSGIVAMWCGLMENANKAGVVRLLSKLMSPVINWLFPDLTGEHGEKAKEYITLNFILNMLGTGWSATGPGLLAMKELQECNLQNDNNRNTASNEMCTFIILNISSLQLIPINIIAYRTAYGSVNPSAIIIPGLIATTISTLTGIIICRIVRIHIRSISKRH